MITAQEAKERLAIRNLKRERIIQAIIEKEKENLEARTLEAIDLGLTKTDKFYLMGGRECVNLSESDLTSFAQSLMAYLGELGYETSTVYNYISKSCMVSWSWGKPED